MSTHPSRDPHRPREALGIDVLGCDQELTSRLHLTAAGPGTELHLST